jgi:hypothetical protein
LHVSLASFSEGEGGCDQPDCVYSPSTIVWLTEHSAFPRRGQKTLSTALGSCHGVAILSIWLRCNVGYTPTFFDQKNRITWQCFCHPGGHSDSWGGKQAQA